MRNIKLDPADIKFSEYIRLRDGECMRCRTLGHGEKGINGLQCSHYFGRGREKTRFDTENCDALCPPCHRYWGSDYPDDYRVFKIRQLGEQGFKLLTIRAHQYARKDRILALIQAKALLSTL